MGRIEGERRWEGGTGPLEVRPENQPGDRRWGRKPLSPTPWLLQAVHSPEAGLPPLSAISPARLPALAPGLKTSGGGALREGVKMPRAALALRSLSGTNTAGPASATHTWHGKVVACRLDGAGGPCGLCPEADVRESLGSEKH